MLRGNTVKKKILLSIKEKEMQMAKLIEHVEKSSVCAELYNKIVLEKAILKKEYENSFKNGLFENIKNILPRKKKLICDYFK